MKDMKSDEKTSSKNKQLGHLLRKCGKQMYFHSSHGIRQTETLKLLYNNGPMSQKELQDTMGITPATISEIITKLEDKELLVRERNSQDRRKVMLSLTEKGKKAAKTRIDENMDFQVGIPMSEEDKDRLIELLEKLDKAFEEKDRGR